MKTAILYRSFRGTTKQYAEWLHETIDSDLYKSSKINNRTLGTYDIIVVCSATYIGWIVLSRYLQRRWNVLKDKTVIFVVVGAAPMDDPWSIRSYEKIPEDIRKTIKYFKLLGKMSSKEAEKVKKENLTPVIEHIKSLEVTKSK